METSKCLLRATAIPILLLSPTLNGCKGGGGAGSGSDPGGCDLDGPWFGETSQGKMFAFIVEGGSLTSLSTGFRLLGGGCTLDVAKSVRFSPPVRISKKGKFDVILPGDTNCIIGGTLQCRGEAGGEIEVEVTPGDPSGCPGRASLTWRASRIGTGPLDGVDVPEEEPNDDLKDTQLLGEVRPGGEFAIHGDVSVNDDVTFDVDGYRLWANGGEVLEIKLHHDRGADFDLVVSDPNTDAVIRECERVSTPEVCQVALGGIEIVDIVVVPWVGRGDYSLEVAAFTEEMRPDVDGTGEKNECLPEHAEREPNFDFEDWQPLGDIRPGCAIRVAGRISFNSDESWDEDGYRLYVDGPQSLEFRLTHDPSDSFILEVQEEKGSGQLLLVCPNSFVAEPPHACSLTFRTTRVLGLVVWPIDGTGSYTLEISSRPAPPPLDGHRHVAPGRGRPLAPGRGGAEDRGVISFRAVQWHLSHQRRDPEHLRRLVDAGEGTPPRLPLTVPAP
ncbi:MAG: hypothetical protein HY721_04495 [Planctomycetes bacterium]|nr:hypothetical protein [Planctomycetota bacterium]